MQINFKLVSEFQTLHRRSFGLTDPDILKPIPGGVKVSLVDGEFLELDSSYQMIRGAATPALVPSFAWAAEQGRYETQALGKGPVLYLGMYEADTLIMDSTGITLGEALEVTTVTVGGIARRGLAQYTSGYKIGYATRLPANNNGWLRFIRLA